MPLFALVTPTTRVRGPKNGVVFLGLSVAAGWGFAVGSGSEAGLKSTEVLEFSACVKNAPGKAGYPC